MLKCNKCHLLHKVTEILIYRGEKVCICSLCSKYLESLGDDMFYVSDFLIPILKEIENQQM